MTLLARLLLTATLFTAACTVAWAHGIAGADA